MKPLTSGPLSMHPCNIWKTRDGPSMTTLSPLRELNLPYRRIAEASPGIPIVSQEGATPYHSGDGSVTRSAAWYE